MAPDRIGDMGEDLIGVTNVRADVGHRKAGPPPGVLVGHLGGGHMKAVVQTIQE